MKYALLSVCAAALIATAASTASAAGFVMKDGGTSGVVLRVDDHRYYDDGYDYDDVWRYSNQDFGYGGYRDDRYGQRDVVSPRWIVRQLRRNDYRYISKPMLAGQFYQVKAVNSRGQKVKLYIDAYSGRVVKIKGKG